MSSGVQRSVRGKFIGTGAELDIHTVGFRPGKLVLWNITGDAKAEWASPMADASMFKTIAAGTTAQVEADGVTPLSDGFTLGADADMNVDGEVVCYEATE